MCFVDASDHHASMKCVRPSGSLVTRYFEHGDLFQILNKIIFDFCTEECQT